MADVQLSTLGGVIKTAYEGQGNTNAFTDAEQTKLSGVATGADVSPVTSVAGEVGVISAAAMTAALNAFTTSLKGLAPASGGGTTNFLRADGTWAAPPGASGGDAWGDAVDADVVPDGDGTRDLGSSANRFASLHVDSIDLNGTTLDGTTLADPGADRILFWDDSAGTTAYLTAGSGLTISGTTITADFSDVVDDTTPQLGGDLDGQGNEIANYLNSVVTSVTGTLTTTAHAGNVLVTSGNVTVPTTAGFSCVIIAGGAHTVTFNSTTSAAMATGDIMTVAVESGTVIHAVLTQAADKVSFS